MRVPPDQSPASAPQRGERHVDVAEAQRAGDVGEAGSEEERVDAAAGAHHRVHEAQQHLGVARHRAGDVAQHHQRRRDQAARAEAQGDVVAGAAQGSAQRGAHVDRRRGTPCIGARAPRRDGALEEADAGDGGARAGQFIGRHLREVLVAQHVALREGQRGVDLDLLRDGRRWRGAARAGSRRAQRLGHAPRQLGRAIGLGHLRVREQQRERLVRAEGIAEERLERLVEQLAVLLALHQHRGQRLAHVLAPEHVDRGERAQGIEQGAGADGKAGGAQHPREVHHVDREEAGENDGRRRGWRRRRR